MKRFFALLICLLMILGLVACGESEPEGTTEPSVSASVEATVPEKTDATTPDATDAEPATPEETEEATAEATTPTEPTPTETESVQTQPQATEPRPTQPSHTHSHQTQTVSATCEQDGYIRNICSCGDISGEVKLPKTGHSWKSASCSAPKTCYHCGATEGDALPHNWKDATYARPKTCQTCQATEGSALAGPSFSVTDSFPKSYNYYSRSFTVNSCEVSFGTDSIGTARYVRISMNVTRNSDSTPTAGKLAFKVNIYDANGTLVKQGSIWSDELAHGTTGLMTASIPLPKSSESSSYSISFVESY